MHSGLAQTHCGVKPPLGHFCGRCRARNHGAWTAQAKQLAHSETLRKRHGSARSGTELHRAALRANAARNPSASTRVTDHEVPELTQVRLNMRVHCLCDRIYMRVLSATSGQH